MAKDHASSFKRELEEKENSKNNDYIWMHREIRSLKRRLAKFERGRVDRNSVEGLMKGEATKDGV